MKRKRNCSQLKEQKKSHEKTNDKTDINNLPDEKFKALVIKKKKLTELRQIILGIPWTFQEGYRKY